MLKAHSVMIFRSRTVNPVKSLALPEIAPYDLLVSLASDALLRM